MIAVGDDHQEMGQWVFSVSLCAHVRLRYDTIR